MPVVAFAASTAPAIAIGRSSITSTARRVDPRPAWMRKKMRATAISP